MKHSGLSRSLFSTRDEQVRKRLNPSVYPLDSSPSLFFRLKGGKDRLPQDIRPNSLQRTNEYARLEREERSTCRARRGEEGKALKVVCLFVLDVAHFKGSDNTVSHGRLVWNVVPWLSEPLPLIGHRQLSAELTSMSKKISQAHWALEWWGKERKKILKEEKKKLVCVEVLFLSSQ